MGVQEILDKWGVDRVEQVIYILGLWGDSVDNIPGIPGIGEKTAKQLIKTYGSVENLIQNSSQLKGKQKENVETFAKQGLLSKQLRSEEHASELQSLMRISYAVLCLKQTKITKNPQHIIIITTYDTKQ